VNFGTLNILVIEDQEPMRNLISYVLESFSVGQITLAENGEEGFKKFQETDPDIILTDWMMEPIDGISLTKEIRTNTLSINRLVPIILVTGYSSKERIDEARDAGVTEILVKPFSARDMAQRLTMVIKRPRDFIETDTFFGPDRRRSAKQDYEGPFRREDDEAADDNASGTFLVG
jgi:CheY-like chemotaxis protein